MDIGNLDGSRVSIGTVLYDYSEHGVNDNRVYFYSRDQLVANIYLPHPTTVYIYRNGAQLSGNIFLQYHPMGGGRVGVRDLTFHRRTTITIEGLLYKAYLDKSGALKFYTREGKWYTASGYVLSEFTYMEVPNHHDTDNSNSVVDSSTLDHSAPLLVAHQSNRAVDVRWISGIGTTVSLLAFSILNIIHNNK